MSAMINGRVAVAALMLGLLAAGAAQAASLELSYKQPERFADAGDGPLERERNLAELESYLRAQAERRLPATQKLSIELLDLNLAGDVKPVGRNMDRLRVIKQVDWPSLEMRYVLSEGDKTLREGKVRLADMSFLDRGSSVQHGSSEPLRYEKRMLDDWFDKEFGAAPAKTAGR